MGLGQFWHVALGKEEALRGAEGERRDEKRFADTLRTGLGGWERWGADAFDEEGSTDPSPSLTCACSLASSAPTVVYRMNCSPPCAPNYRGPERVDTYGV